MFIALYLISAYMGQSSAFPVALMSRRNYGCFLKRELRVCYAGFPHLPTALFPGHAVQPPGLSPETADAKRAASGFTASSHRALGDLRLRPEDA